jgi:hypothetical protein
MHSLEIVGLALHPKIKVLGIARTVIETNSVATNDKVANALFGEYRQEILEVLVQVRLPSSDSTPRSPSPRPHPGGPKEERASKTVGLPQLCPNERPRRLRAKSLDAGEPALRSSIPWTLTSTASRRNLGEQRVASTRPARVLDMTRRRLQSRLNRVGTGRATGRRQRSFVRFTGLDVGLHRGDQQRVPECVNPQRHDDFQANKTQDQAGLRLKETDDHGTLCFSFCHARAGGRIEIP